MSGTQVNYPNQIAYAWSRLTAVSCFLPLFPRQKAFSGWREVMSRFLNVLRSWLVMVSIIAIGNTLQSFRDHTFLYEKLYTGKPDLGKKSENCILYGSGLIVVPRPDYPWELPKKFKSKHHRYLFSPPNLFPEISTPSGAPSLFFRNLPGDSAAG